MENIMQSFPLVSIKADGNTFYLDGLDLIESNEPVPILLMLYNRSGNEFSTVFPETYSWIYYENRYILYSISIPGKYFDYNVDTNRYENGDK